MSEPELTSPSLPTPEAPSAEASLHEFIDAEFSISGLDAPADEQRLTQALEGQDGVRHYSLAPGKVTLEYDPVAINKARISALLQAAGFPVGEIESSSASAVLEAMKPAAEEPLP